MRQIALQSQSFQPASVFAVLVVVVTFALLLNAVMSAIERLLNALAELSFEMDIPEILEQGPSRSLAHQDTFQRLRQARTHFLNGEDPSGLVRPEILQSWHRSRMAVSPTAPLDVRAGPQVNPDSILLRAAGPVVRALIEDLAAANVWVQLSDRNAQIVGRWAPVDSGREKLDEICSIGSVVEEGLVGTTVLATVLEEKRPFAVWGSRSTRRPGAQRTPPPRPWTRQERPTWSDRDPK